MQKIDIMNIYSLLIEAKTLDEIKSIEKWAMNVLSDNQKSKLQILVRRARARIENKK